MPQAVVRDHNGYLRVYYSRRRVSDLQTVDRVGSTSSKVG
jgi:hypothetical protein